MAKKDERIMRKTKSDFNGSISAGTALLFGYALFFHSPAVRCADSDQREYDKASAETQAQANTANTTDNEKGNTTSDSSTPKNGTITQTSNKAKLDRELPRAEATEDCGLSQKLGKGCSGSRGFVKAAQVLSPAMLQLGAAGVQVHAQVESLNRDQTSIKENLKTSADILKNTSKVDMGIGAANMALGIAQLYYHFKHNGAAKEIEDVTLNNKLQSSAEKQGKDKFILKNNVPDNQKGAGHDTTRGDDNNSHSDAFVHSKNNSTQDAIDAFDLQVGVQQTLSYSQEQIKKQEQDKNKAEAAFKSAQGTPNAEVLKSKFKAEENKLKDMQETRAREITDRNSVVKQKASKMQRSLSQHGGMAAQEQRNVADAALGGAITALVAGAGQALKGTLNLMAAKKMEKAANEYEDTKVTPPPSDPFPTNFDPPNTAANPISPIGLGTPADTAPSNEGEQKDELAEDIGVPSITPKKVELAEPSPINANPNNGVAANQPRGGGGGGAPLGSAGSTNEAKPASETEQQPRASETRGPLYEGGAGGGVGGGIGGGGGGVKDTGLDLSGLLAQFLPKKEDDANKEGILNYGRAVDGKAAPEVDSLLDRDQDLFKRISAQYQLQAKKHRI